MQAGRRPTSNRYPCRAAVSWLVTTKPGFAKPRRAACPDRRAGWPPRARSTVSSSGRPGASPRRLGLRLRREGLERHRWRESRCVGVEPEFVFPDSDHVGAGQQSRPVDLRAVHVDAVRAQVLQLVAAQRRRDGRVLSRHLLLREHDVRSRFAPDDQSGSAAPDTPGRQRATRVGRPSRRRPCSARSSPPSWSVELPDPGPRTVSPS